MQGTTRQRQQRDDPPRSRSIGKRITASIRGNKNRTRTSSTPSVSFGEVSVRSYHRSIGDWWDIEHSLGLGWEYEETPAVPLPEEDDDDEKRGENSKFKKNARKAKVKAISWLIVAGKKTHTMEMISQESIENLRRKSEKYRIRTKKKDKKREETNSNSGKKKSLTYESNNRLTPDRRQEVLKEFGFSGLELETEEITRKLLNFEYSHWTRASQKSSQLFLQRCLADATGIDAGDLPSTSTRQE